jgi:hypothetical protein
MSAQCSHSSSIVTATPNAAAARSALLSATHGCVFVCVDLRARRHATKHFRLTRHPIVTCLEAGKDWSWRYINELVLELG